MIDRAINESATVKRDDLLVAWIEFQNAMTSWLLGSNFKTRALFFLVIQILSKSHYKVSVGEHAEESLQLLPSR